MCLLAAGCGAASEVGSSTAPTTLALFDATTSTSTPEDGPSPTTGQGQDESTSSSTTATTERPAVVPTSDSTNTTLEPAPSSTTQLGPTIPVVDPYEAFCEQVIAVEALGTFTTPDDPEATNSYFTAQAEAWALVATAAPPALATDAQIVATYFADWLGLLEANGFDLFAILPEITALEEESGADLARLRVDQFTYSACDVDPPLAEQATAVFYIGLLETPDDRAVLAELLASAEIFPLDGAMCFVEQATEDAIHPLVGAPATPAQDAALAAVLSACQLSIGT